MGKAHIPFEPVAPAAQARRSVRARLVELLVDDAPDREEVRRRIRSKPGFWATLSPEARAAVMSYDGPENLGPPHPRR
jgi:hypothetical protein